jgi:hypothetical protein
LCINTFACLKLNQYLSELFVSYSSEKPNCTKMILVALKWSPLGGSVQVGSSLACKYQYKVVRLIVANTLAYYETPLEWSTVRGSVRVGSGLACKYPTSVVVDDSDKHFSLL